jgi:3-oxoadipate enol-lactonase/4-carboxymuconolactone decarboxylase
MTAPPELTGVHFNTVEGATAGYGKPLLVLGPSLGTSAPTLWGACAGLLTERYHVIGWDLPGHGGSPAARQYFDLPALADSVLALVDGVLADRGERGGTFFYAGDSVGGAVGLQLLLDHPGRISAAAVICSGARIGTPQNWLERAETVRANGTPSMVTGSAARWFAAGFVERRLAIASALLQALQDTERFSYSWTCEALAAFDVRDRLAEITVPVLAVAGSDDVVTPPEFAQEIAAGVRNGRLAVIQGVAHLAPAENPAEVAALIGNFIERPEPSSFASSPSFAGSPSFTGPSAFGEPPAFASSPSFGEPSAFGEPSSFGEPPAFGEPSNGYQNGLGARTVDQVLDDGMRVRREVLGDAHVDRAIVSATEFTADFQELITSYAWGSIWTRPGLDRRSRSMITLTALVALGHHEELALHVRAARTNGLSDDEIKEVLLQSAIYCGVPAANTAFRIAQSVLNQMDAE